MIRLVKLVCLCTMIMYARPLVAAEISEGDSLERVYDTLGLPNGRMKRGKKLFLMYDRGQVIIVDGKVSSFQLVSKNELAEQKRARREMIAEQNARRERDIAQRIAEGRAKKVETLEDEDFSALPPEKRLEFWKDFQGKYPEVSVKAEIAAVAGEIHAERLNQIEDEITGLKEKLEEARLLSRTANEWRVRRESRNSIPVLEKQLEAKLQEKARLEQGL